MTLESFQRPTVCTWRLGVTEETSATNLLQGQQRVSTGRCYRHQRGLFMTDLDQQNCDTPSLIFADLPGAKHQRKVYQSSHLT